MAKLAPSQEVARWSRLAGVLYAMVIVTGLGAELGLRGPLIDLDNARATATAILNAPRQFRLAIGADLVMALCDVGLTILLYLIFRAVSPVLALGAMVFRLVQAVLIASNLLALQIAWMLLSNTDEIANSPFLALIFLELHGQGYDLGLVFFGVNSLLMGVLVWQSGLFARIFGAALAIAGAVYLIGSGLRFFAPEFVDLFAPAYILPILAESAFCLRLLFQGAKP